MGIYVYTLRKNTLTAIDMDIGAPVEIGVTAYAYKQSWGWNSPEYNRKTARMHSMAERARDANPNLVLVTFGNPADHDFDRYGKMAVYRVKPWLTSFYDTEAPGEQVGYLFKNGRKFEFERNV
jgi:hypothetical protein